MPGGTVKLTPEHGSALTLILNGPPDRSGGVGGWQATERAGRRPGKWWQGIPDDAMTLDCMLDLDAIPGPSIERRLKVLRTMGQPREDSDGEPPSIRIAGDIWNNDQTIVWVISDLKLGDRLFTPDGDLRRQQVSVDVERFNAMQEVQPLRVKRTRPKGGKRRRHVVHAHAHDTLRAIALRELGSPSRWQELREWNKRLRKVDPDAPLRRGTHVTIR